MSAEHGTEVKLFDLSYAGWRHTVKQGFNLGRHSKLKIETQSGISKELLLSDSCQFIKSWSEGCSDLTLHPSGAVENIPTERVQKRTGLNSHVTYLQERSPYQKMQVYASVAIKGSAPTGYALGLEKTSINKRQVHPTPVPWASRRSRCNWL